MKRILVLGAVMSSAFLPQFPISAHGLHGGPFGHGPHDESSPGPTLPAPKISVPDIPAPKISVPDFRIPGTTIHAPAESTFPVEPTTENPDNMDVRQQAEPQQAEPQQAEPQQPDTDDSESKTTIEETIEDLYSTQLCHNGFCEKFDHTPEGRAKYEARLKEIQMQKAAEEAEEQKKRREAFEAARQERERKFQASKQLGLRIANHCDRDLVVNLRYTNKNGKLRTTKIKKLKAGKVDNIKRGIGADRKYVLIDKSMPLLFHASDFDQSYVWNGTHEYSIKNATIQMRKIAFSKLNTDDEGLSTLFLDCSQTLSNPDLAETGPQYPSSTISSSNPSHSTPTQPVQQIQEFGIPHQQQRRQESSLPTDNQYNIQTQQPLPIPNQPASLPSHQAFVTNQESSSGTLNLPPHLKLISQPVRPVTQSDISYMDYVLKRLDWNTVPIPTNCKADPSSYVTIRYGVLGACVQADNFHTPGQSYSVQ